LRVAPEFVLLHAAGAGLIRRVIVKDRKENMSLLRGGRRKEIVGALKGLAFKSAGDLSDETRQILKRVTVIRLLW
jgi:hypothetical protein